MENLVRRRRQRLRFEGRVAGQHLVENHAGREYVGACVGQSALKLLGRHVLRRTCDQFRLRQRTVNLTDFIDERPRETKVEKLDAVLRQEDVRGFQVAVYHAAAVKGVESAEHLDADAYRLTQWNDAAIQMRRQRLAVEPFHRQKELVIGLTDLVDLTDVRVIDPRGEPGFAPEAFAHERVVNGLLADDFQRQGSSEAVVHRRVDDTHSAFTKLAGDAVSANLVWEHRSCRVTNRLRRDRKGGLGQKTLRGGGSTQKQGQFEPQTLVAVAFAVEENLALVRWSILRQVINAFDFPPALWVHGPAFARTF